MRATKNLLSLRGRSLWRQNLCRCWFWTLLLFISTTRAGDVSFIEPDTHLNGLILRVARRCDIPVPESFFSQPMSVNHLTCFFAHIDSCAHLSGVLSSAEQHSLDAARKLFASERSLYSWRDSARTTLIHSHLSLLGEILPSYNDSTNITMKGIIQPAVSVSRNHLSLYSQAAVWTAFRSDTFFRTSSYEPYHGIPYNLYGREDSSRIVSADMIRGGIRYQGEWLSTGLLLDYLRQGPAVFYPLTFSGTAPPVPQWRTRMNFRALRYIHTTAHLQTQKNRPKYLYTHRLELPFPRQRFLVGINEMVVNGSTAEKAQSDSLRPDYYGRERSWEPLYMVPFIPYVFAEHFLGDIDNALLSFDVNCAYPRFFRWYFEFLLDDFTNPLTLFSNDWGNKWALNAGGQWFGSVRGRDVTVSAEYSRVEPWVYTHFYGGSHRFSHFGKVLGHPLGPDADALVLAADMSISPRVTLGLHTTNTRKGGGRGSDVRHVFQDSTYQPDSEILPRSAPDSWKKTFLGRHVERSTRIGMACSLAPFELFSCDATVDYDMGTEKGIMLHLAGGFRF